MGTAMKSLAVAFDAPRGHLVEVKKAGAIRKGMRAMTLPSWRPMLVVMV